MYRMYKMYKCIEYVKSIECIMYKYIKCIIL